MVVAALNFGRVQRLPAANRQPVRLIQVESAEGLANLGRYANLYGAPLAFIVVVTALLNVFFVQGGTVLFEWWIIRISEADVFVYNGGESEQWVENILDAAGENIPYVLSMMGAAELHEEEFSEGMQGQGANAHEHSDHDHGHGENGGADDAEDEETEYDEHIWTSPVTAMALCRAIGETLCQADPDHADSYRQRLADYLTELESLDQSFRDVVAGGSRRLLVFGDRFPLLYFCREYGLDYRAAFHGCAGDTEPSLATLKYLIDLVNEEHIPVVYTIELSSRKVAEAIAETTGAAVRTFQSCQTVSRADFDNGVTYLQLMEANVDALREGLA